MQPRKDRRFKQWNKTRISLMKDPRNSHKHPATDAFTHDISLGGARIHSRAPFEPGTLVRLQIDLMRTGETLRVEGLVKWLRQSKTDDIFEVGVEFQHTSMITVLALMKALHDGRRPDPAQKDETAGLNRSGPF
jgi:hypothetical protein